MRRKLQSGAVADDEMGFESRRSDYYLRETKKPALGNQRRASAFLQCRSIACRASNPGRVRAMVERREPA